MRLAIFSPAKINLYLAVTGRREDGFHDLVSVVAPVAWGDTLWLETVPDGPCTCSCDHPEVPVDDRNLVLRAARAFAEASRRSLGVHLHLDKRIPLGAGLGGGSSNAAAALRGLNQLAGYPLGPEDLKALAAQVGSDCALFLERGPVAIRGRGEQVSPLPSAAAARLRGQRVLLFKPGWGISTPWAYARLAARAPSAYTAPAEAEAWVKRWLETVDAPLESLLANDFEAAVGSKYLALPVLCRQLREIWGLAVQLSGSGSACFALLPEAQPVAPVAAAIREAWGEEAFIQETTLL